MNERDMTNQIRAKLRAIGYADEQIASEYDIPGEWRADFVAIDEEGNPELVVEVKTDLNVPTGRRQLEQTLDALNAKLGLLTDGVKEHWYAHLLSGETVEIPAVKSRNEIVSVPSRAELKPIEDPTYASWRLVNSLQGRPLAGSYLREVSKLILCKLIDEKVHEGPGRFFTKTKAEGGLAGDAKGTKIGMDSLFREVKQIFPGLFDEDEQIQLSEDVLFKAVAELQSYSIEDSPQALLRLLQEFAKRDGRTIGPEFTPKPAVDLLTCLLRPTISDSVLDLGCGSGGILIAFVEFLKRYSSKFDLDSYTSSKLFGLEKDRDMATMAKINMILLGDGHSNILVGDVMSKAPILKAVLKPTDPEGFDIVVSDPPFGAKIDSPDPLLKSNQGGTVLFLERAIELVKPGGRVAIIVPEGFLFNEKMNDYRMSLKSRVVPLAIVSLPAGSRMPLTGVKTSLIVFRKEPAGAHDKVFIAEVRETTEIPGVVETFEMGGSGPGAKYVDAGDLGTNWTVGRLLFPHTYSGESLGRVLTFIKRGSQIPQGGYVDKRHPKAVPYIRISDMQRGSVALLGVKCVPRDGFLHTPVFLRRNQLLLSIRGTLGKAALVPKEAEGAVASSQIAVLEADESKVIPEYLLRLLSSDPVRDQVDRAGTGSYIRQISLEAIQDLRVIVPSLSRQKETLERVRRLEDDLTKIKSSEEEIRRKLDDEWRQIE